MIDYTDQDTGKKTKSKNAKKWLILIGGLLSIILILIGLAPANLTKPLLDRRGWIKEGYFYYGPKGPVMLSALSHTVDSTSSTRGQTKTTTSSYSWLVSINLTDGSRLARKEFTKKVDYQNHDPVRFLGHTDDFIWTISEGAGLHGRDPYTGEILISQENILEQNSSLTLPSFVESIRQSYGEFSNYIYDFAGKGMLVETSAEKYFLIDAVTLIAEPAALDDIKPRLGIRHGFQLSKNTGQLSLHTSGIFYTEGDFPYRLNPEISFHDAFFVIDETLDDYLRITEPDSVLVTYSEDYSENSREFLARVRVDGFRVWATDLFARVEIASINDGLIYAVAGGVLFNIDSLDGTVLWMQSGDKKPADTNTTNTSDEIPNQPDFSRPEPLYMFSPESVVPGLLVLANYEGEGNYYPATVLEITSDDAFVVMYLDGGIETVALDALTQDDLRPGAVVEILLNDSWIPAFVSRRSGTSLGLELPGGSSSWASLILTRRNPSWGRISRLEGVKTSTPLSLTRYGESSDYYFSSVPEPNQTSATVLYLDGTWESRDSSDIIEGSIQRGDPVTWIKGSEQLDAKLDYILGLVALLSLNNGEKQWASLAHIYITRSR
ncbi:MAG: hypothetical protein HN368_09385 [Spirochaetales bacterium]|jgi:hypothetical protein|nr:hypothetical protein [Spirochaetales bacterium]